LGKRIQEPCSFQFQVAELGEAGRDKEGQLFRIIIWRMVVSPRGTFRESSPRKDYPSIPGDYITSTSARIMENPYLIRGTI
jgi:hypothetical protein